MSTAWPSVSLGELIRLERRPVEVIADRDYQEIGTYSYGRGIFHKRPRSGLEVGDKDLFLMKEGDLILQITFAWEGAIALCSKAEDGLYGSVRYPTYRVDESRCFAPFLVKYLCTRQGLDQIGRICPGSAGRNRVLALKRLPEISVPLPPPDEQRRIVARIEELTAKVEEAGRLREKSARETDACFLKQLEVRRHALSASHPTRLLGQTTKVTSGGTPAREIEAYWGGDIPWIKTGELLDADIFQASEHLTNQGLENSSAKLFPPDTILIALYGQGQTRGRTGRLRIHAATNQACCAILPSDRLAPGYIQWWFRSLYSELREKSQGGAQPNWNGGMIKDLPIAIPPLALQIDVATELDALQAKVASVKALQAETAAELDAMLPAILDKAFKGEL